MASNPFTIRIHLAVLVFVWCTSFVRAGTQFQYQYMGCFRDNVDVNKRALSYLQWIDKTMTVDKCVEECGRHGFQWSALEYAEECYCSKHGPKTEKVEDSKCEMKCAGGVGKCGGASAVGVFLSQHVRPPPDDGRPLLCLVMILKDEAHTIMSTLKNVKPYIDCWHILDTGSTDDTINIIRNYMTDKPGELYEEPFVDYGTTRNRILELSRTKSNPVYNIMLSADETVNNPTEMRAWLEDFRHANGTIHSAYPVLMNNAGQEFESLRLSRSDYGWRYKGRAHEYLADPNGHVMALLTPMPLIRVKFEATDHDRRFRSQWLLKKFLEEDLAKNPNDTRSIYYLARTNSGIGNHSAAYEYYKMLTARSKWDEEIYHGMVMAAEESKILGLPWQERQQLLMEAYQYKPQQMDALHLLAQEHYNAERLHLAYMVAKRMVEIPPPESLKVVENVLLRNTRYLYEYEGYRLLGFCASKINEWQTCVDAFRKVMARRPDDTYVADRLRACEEQLKTAPQQQLQQPALSEEEANAPAVEESGGGEGDLLRPPPVVRPQPPTRPIDKPLTFVQDPAVRPALTQSVYQPRGWDSLMSGSSGVAMVLGAMAVTGFVLFVVFSKLGGLKKLRTQ